MKLLNYKLPRLGIITFYTIGFALFFILYLLCLYVVVHEFINNKPGARVILPAIGVIWLHKKVTGRVTRFIKHKVFGR